MKQKKNKLQTVARVGTKKNATETEITLEEVPKYLPQVKGMEKIGNMIMANRRPLFIVSSAVHLYSVKKLNQPTQIMSYASACHSVLYGFGQVLRQPDMGSVIAAPRGGYKPPGMGGADDTPSGSGGGGGGGVSAERIVKGTADTALQVVSPAYFIARQTGIIPDW